MTKQVVLCFVTMAAATTSTTTNNNTTLPETFTEENLKKFFDTTLPSLMEEHFVPGAAIILVNSNGETIFKSGYGYATLDNDANDNDDDAAARRPGPTVTTTTTPFAAGSIAKLFVWTSVMQLVEQNLLDLNVDINTYLDFEIPNDGFHPQSEMITLKHLMTHTAGFEDYPLIGVFVRNEKDIPKLGDALRERIPKREWSPGLESAYNNYGTALAGYIVELVTGMPYHEYVNLNILQPLNMTMMTSVELPPPQHIRNVAAKGYVHTANDEYIHYGNEFLTIAPAGTIHMSVEDAGKFMTAYLNDGSLSSGSSNRGGNDSTITTTTRILQPDTVDLIRTSTLFQNDLSLPGNTYGFWQSRLHDETIIYHKGDTDAFAAYLALFPERNFGYYLTTNGGGGLTLREDLFEAFLDEFFPSNVPNATNPVDDNLDDYVGTYASNRASTTSLGKILNLFTKLKIRRSDDGKTLVSKIYGMEHTWKPLGNGRFVDMAREGEEMVIQRNSKIFFSEAPMLVFRPIHWYDSNITHIVFLAVGSLLLLSGLIGFPLQARRAWKLQQMTIKNHHGKKRDVTKKDTSDKGDEGGEEQQEIEEVDEGSVEEVEAKGNETNDETTSEETTVLNKISMLAPRVARWIGTTFCLFILLFGVFFSLAMNAPIGPQFGVSPMLRAGLVFATAGAVLAFLYIPFWAAAWIFGWWSISSRIHATFVLIGAMMIVWQMFYWKVLAGRI